MRCIFLQLVVRYMLSAVVASLPLKGAALALESKNPSAVRGGVKSYQKACTDNEKNLMKAVVENDRKEVARLLKEGTSPYIAEYSATLPLRDLKPAVQLAIEKKLVTLVKVLCKAGLDPNVPFPDKKTCLFVVCYSEPLDYPLATRLSILDILLKHGARINVPIGTVRLTPLMVAARRDADLVEYLLSRNANPALQDAHGDTALTWCCWKSARSRASGVTTFPACKIMEHLLLARGLKTDYYFTHDARHSSHVQESDYKIDEQAHCLLRRYDDYPKITTLLRMHESLQPLLIPTLILGYISNDGNDMHKDNVTDNALISRSLLLLEGVAHQSSHHQATSNESRP